MVQASDIYFQSLSGDEDINMLMEKKTLASDTMNGHPCEGCVNCWWNIIRRLIAALGTSCVLTGGALDHMATALQQDLDERRDV